MKKIHLILALLPTVLFAAPEFDSLGDRPPAYMFISPTTPGCIAHRAPTLYGYSNKVNIKHLRVKDMTLFKSESDKFYAKFRNIVNADSAINVPLPKNLYLEMRSNAHLGNYATLKLKTLRDWIKSKDRPHLTSIFLHYSHPKNPALVFHTTISSDLQNINKMSSLKEDRLKTLDLLYENNIELNIFNRFYEIPLYVKNHKAVNVIEDKPDHENPFSPKLFDWTRLDGRSITAGYLYSADDNVLLWLNKRVYFIPTNSLSEESKMLARRLSSDKPIDYEETCRIAFNLNVRHH